MSVLVAVSPTPTPTHNAGPLTHIWDGAPKWIVSGAIVVVALGVLFTQVKPLAQFAMLLGRLLMRPFRRPDPDEQYRIRQRQLFARHVEAQLKQLAGKEEWRDERFAELEAEVEVEGRVSVMRWLRRSSTRNIILRREKSLSKALARTTESLVILEGEPGSGKSVALRHLAEKLAREAQARRSATSLVPLYVNLKEFKPAHRPVNSKAIRNFIVESLNRANDRDVELFLDEEFDRGLHTGTWLLLLDSFDEIPDILSSTESDSAVEEYANAIHDFLFAMKASRAIVASREFRGPKTFQVPRFRIVSLTPKQQANLIQRSGLRPAQQGSVHEGLAVADPELQQMTKNPMFLGLVCEYVRVNHQFPPNTHSAYDSYLEQRLKRDGDRIRQKYGVGTSLVRRTAEEIAFCMAAVTGLGLSPSRQQLRTALAATGTVSIAQLGNVLNALEYTKLGRTPDEITGSADKRFTFAHRRFQEYFATRVALREPHRVSAHELMTNGRWRETAVTILQTQPPEATTPLLDEAELLLTPMVLEATDAPESGVFTWPPGSLHILQLLDAGLGRAPEHIPAKIRSDVGTLLRTAWERGRRHDRKWATNVALIADRDNTIWLLNQAFASGSIFLGGVAYSCVSRLQDPPLSMYDGVRLTLVDMAINGQLNEGKYSEVP